MTTKKMTVEDALKAFNQLKQLNGYEEVKGDRVTIRRYLFADGGALTIADNINTLRAVVKNYNDAVEMLPEEGKQKGVEEILKSEVEVVVRPITRRALNTDVNPLEPGLIADLIYRGFVT